LSGLAGAPDYSFRSALEDSWRAAGLDENVLDGEDAAARKAVDDAIQRRKIVAAHYQHADGTSFAAPITASVIAQMIEVNPSLTPAAVKNILISTATRLGGHPAIRQGFGVVNARLAMDRARSETHVLDSSAHHPPRIEGDSIVFSFHDHNARSVSLAGDFNVWNTKANPLVLCEDKIWRVRIPCKFHVDGTRWTEDRSHLLKEDDGFGGFNSLLRVAGISE
jgi:serine protease AprX